MVSLPTDIHSCRSHPRRRTWPRIVVLIGLLIAMAATLAACASAEASPRNEVVPIDSSGAQTVTIVVSHEGYTPSQITVKKGVPVQVIFRETGKLACSCCNTLIFPTDPTHSITVQLSSADDQKVITFTPATAGTYTYRCPCKTTTGTVTVTP